MKKIYIIIGIVAILIIVLTWHKEPTQEVAPVTSSYKNVTFDIDGNNVSLKNGPAEIANIQDSASATTINYFGNEATGDLNGDGLPDTAFLVTKTTGGSGTFYYAVVALKTADGYKGTNAFFIGDRIAPQANNINESARELYINYAERKPSEPMTAKPSVGATKILIVTPDGKLQGLMQ